MKSQTLALLLAPLFASACALTGHATRPSMLGKSARASDLLALIDTPGPIELETINSSDWSVDRGGLINLGNPRARAAGLKDGPEPIQIYFHVLRHPKQGLFIIDTGVERALRDAPRKAAIRGPVASYMKMERLRVQMPLGDWLAKQSVPLAGVFLTHLHLDHVSGVPDVPPGTPIYAGRRHLPPAWGWIHDVEPGGFTDDTAANVESLARLRRLVREHPSIEKRENFRIPIYGWVMRRWNLPVSRSDPAPQLGQMPRPLHDKATTMLWLQSRQCARIAPLHKMPQSK